MEKKNKYEFVFKLRSGVLGLDEIDRGIQEALGLIPRVGFKIIEATSEEEANRLFKEWVGRKEKT